MIYAVTGNSLLSASAKALDDTQIAMYGAIAENLLGLDTIPKFTDAGAIATATGAVAMQINHLLDVGGIELIKTWSQGARSETFRDDVTLVSTLARIAVQSIVGAPTTSTRAYKAMTSARADTSEDTGVPGPYPFW